MRWNGWLKYRQKVSIANRYFSGVDPKVIAADEKVHFTTVYRVAREMPATHNHYCEYCFSSRIHQKWCERMK